VRVLIDTNVLISAALNATGVPFRAYIKAASYPNHGLICEQNVDEMKRIFNKKFPHRMAALDKFLSIALLTLELVPVPTEEDEAEMLVRDVNDRPILRAAIFGKADILLTGDKDFLESGLDDPKIMTPAEFLKTDFAN
jgi:putative PIN family toxin of toxin-antitoxin system